MEDAPASLLFALLILLILLSGFFSSSETGMMALNRYRLKHLARKGNKHAIKAQSLLEKPDKLIGAILIGNNFVNIFASAVATILAVRYFGNSGIAIATTGLTLVILIFSEVTPKTFAAVRPERVAFSTCHVLAPLLKIFYPLIWIVNLLSSMLLKPLGIDTKKLGDKPLSKEEIRSLVNESTSVIPTRNRKMLTNILDLEHVTVEDLMVPRHDIVGIDIEDDFDRILKQLSSTQHTRLLVYRNNLNDPIGMLHMRKFSRFLSSNEEKNKANFLQHTVEPTYTLESTSVYSQLNSFQKAKRRLSLVVDEYGEIKGLVTLEDILEEIVGEFTTDLSNSIKEIRQQEDGKQIIDGSTTLRNINKYLKWKLPTKGPKTLSGLIIEELEFIPQSSLSLKIEGYFIEVIQTKDNMIKTAKLWAEETNESQQYHP